MSQEYSSKEYVQHCAKDLLWMIQFILAEAPSSAEALLKVASGFISSASEHEGDNGHQLFRDVYKQLRSLALADKVIGRAFVHAASKGAQGIEKSLIEIENAIESEKHGDSNCESNEVLDDSDISELIQELRKLL